jgi:hypothetical protein
LLRDGRLLSVPARLALAIAAALFLPLAATGLLFKLPAGVAPHLNSGFALLLVVLVLGLVTRAAPLRAKLGVAYLAAPLLLHCYWLLTQQVPSLAPTGARADLPSRVFEIGEHLVVVGAYAAFLFFAPAPRLSRLLEPLPLVVALSVTGVAGLFVQMAYPMTAQAAYYGLGVNLPSPSFEATIYLAGLFFFAATTSALLARPGPSRSTGLGLLAIALSGYQLQLPYQFLLTTVGMMLLVRAAIASRQAEESSQQPAPSREPSAAQWQSFLALLARRCGLRDDDERSPEIVLLHNDRNRIIRLRCERDGLSLLLRLMTSAAQIEELELTVGHPPKQPATTSLARRRLRRGRRVPNGRGPKTDFDPQFVLRDASGRASELLSASELRQNLTRWMHGVVNIWPEEGLQYFARPLADGWPVPLAEIVFCAEDATTTELEALIDLLLQLARAADVGHD